jgi:hypothetical protein
MEMDGGGMMAMAGVSIGKVHKNYTDKDTRRKKKMIPNQKIIDLIKTRLEGGAQKYGEELKPDDGRDWIEESIEELLDACVYLSAKLLLIKEHEEISITLPVNPDEVEMLYKALDAYSASRYIEGENKTSKKFRDLASRIAVAGKIDT